MLLDKLEETVLGDRLAEEGGCNW